MKTEIWKRFVKPPLSSLNRNNISVLSVGVPTPYHRSEKLVMVASLKNFHA